MHASSSASGRVRRRSRGLAPLLVVLGMVLVGCGGGSEQRADAPAASASGPDGSPSGSAEPSPSEPSDAGTAAALWPDGQVVDLEVATVRVPRKYEVVEQPVPGTYHVKMPGKGTIQLSALPLVGDLTSADEVQLSLDELERDVKDLARGNESFRLLERRDVNGVEMIHYVERLEPVGSPTRNFMAEHADKQMMFGFIMREEFPPEDEIIDQVLSTVEWGEDQS